MAETGEIYRGNVSGRLIRLGERMNDGWACDVQDPRWPGVMWRGGEWISDWQLTHCTPFPDPDPEGETR